MESGISHRIERNEDIWHNTTAAINHTMFLERLKAQGVSKVNAVGVSQFATLQTVLHVLLIIFQVAFLVWLLYATTGRSVIVSNGETYLRTVGQVDGALHQSLAKRASTDNRSSVVILYGSRDNLRSGSRILVDEHGDGQLLQRAVAMSLILIAAHRPTLGIYNHIALAQKLVGNLHGTLKIATAIVLQVEDKAPHPLTAQGVGCLHKFIIGLCAKALQTDIAHLRPNHIGSSEGVYGYAVALHYKIECLLHTPAHHSEAHLRAFLAPEALHYLRTFHLHSGNGCVVHADDTVACDDAHLFRRSVEGWLYHHQCVFHHVKLYTDALKVALQGFLHRLRLLGISVRRMRVELLQHTTNSILRQLSLIHRVHIQVVYRHLCHLQLPQRGVTTEVQSNLCMT